MRLVRRSEDLLGRDASGGRGRAATSTSACARSARGGRSSSTGSDRRPACLLRRSAGGRVRPTARRRGDRHPGGRVPADAGSRDPVHRRGERRSLRRTRAGRPPPRRTPSLIRAGRRACTGPVARAIARSTARSDRICAHGWAGPPAPEIARSPSVVSSGAGCWSGTATRPGPPPTRHCRRASWTRSATWTRLTASSLWNNWTT